LPLNCSAIYISYKISLRFPEHLRKAVHLASTSIGLHFSHALMSNVLLGKFFPRYIQPRSKHDKELSGKLIGGAGKSRTTSNRVSLLLDSDGPAGPCARLWSWQSMKQVAWT